MPTYLTVMSASAGSGKTHQLVNHYLKILLSESKDDRHYKSIVAMTFTNKAAYEMKHRILQTLDTLAHPQEDQSKVTEVINVLTAALVINETTLRSRAQKALTEILHGYEDFHVSTIDKFNLRLIRSFNRDLDLPQDFEIIMNEKEILEKVVDAIFAKIGNPNYPELSNLVENYTRKNLDDGTNWNFRDQLIQFSSILSHEKYINIVKKLIENPVTETDLNAAGQTKRDLVGRLKAKGDRCVSLFYGLNLPEEKLPGKSKTRIPIVALGGLKAWPKLKDNEMVFTDTFLANLDHQFKGQFSNELVDALLDFQDFVFEFFQDYYKVAYFIETYYNLALLQYVATEIDEMKKNDDFIRISEFNKLIASLVQDQEAPHIYEKLGTRLKYFLLDEFQDTSRMQWMNMVPLIHESISKGQLNLIVGDPKQSIYRFNNGLADQFVCLPALYNPEGNHSVALKSNLFETVGELVELDENYRSADQIVEFNNLFFEAMRPLIPAASSLFYQSIRQEAKKNIQGFVKIVSAPVSEDALDVYEEILSIIEKCISDGFKPGDICILSEKNKQGSLIAQFLTANQYKVVSADSLLIHTDAKVRLCISYFKRRDKPSNPTEMKKFAELYLRLTLSESAPHYLALFDEVVRDGRTYRNFNDVRFLDTYFGGELKFFMNYENLYDLVQKFFAIMDWKETEDAYLHHFADVCFNFQNGKKIDLVSFLEHYDSQKTKMAIQLPETDDAIKIMTIHKSKGLQFPVVIAPDLDFSLNANKSSYLIEDDDQVYYRKLSTKSPLEKIRDFSEIELALIFMDKLNLLYVALTRPVYRLYAFNFYKAKNMGSYIYPVFSGLAPENAGSSLRELTIGSEDAVNLGNREQDTFYFPENTKDRLWYPELVINQKPADSAQNFGNGFHAIIAQSQNPQQITAMTDRLIQEGIIDGGFRTELIEAVETLFKHKIYLDWLTNAELIRNEQWMVTPEGDLFRPDQIIETKSEIIIIDFKTGVAAESHMKQIKSYANMVKKIEIKVVKSFLYYSKTNSWVEGH